MHGNAHYPEWCGALRHFYWSLRAVRGYDQARRRKLYRYIRQERDRLAECGINQELIRLLCRHLSNPTCRQQAARLAAFERQMHLQRFKLAYADLLPANQVQMLRVQVA